MPSLRPNPNDRPLPRNYLSSREKRRLSILVLSLGLVLIFMFEAAKPNNWNWLWHGNLRGLGGANSATDHYDTQVRPNREDSLPLDTFVAALPQPPKVDKKQKPYYRGVNPELLQAVRDHTIDRTVEHPAWFNLLEVLQKASLTELKRASLGDVGFVPLYEQPEAYRGQLVTVRGIVKRAFDIQARANSAGIEHLHQLWLFPLGGPDSPLVIYTLQLPDGFPSSRTAGGKFRNLSEEVSVTGFFFKNWAYTASEGQVLSAPLLVAQTVEWTKPTTVKTEPIQTSTIVWRTLIGAGLGIALALFFFYRHAPTRPGKAGRHLFQTPIDSAQQNSDVGAMLAKLAAEEQHGSTSGPIQDDSRSQR